MQLIIMRHGEAGWHSDDRQRALTDAGRIRAELVARQISASEDWRPAQLWCSPLVRARQTADIVGRVLGLVAEERSFLTPDDDPAQCLDMLQVLGEEATVMLVSHMPFVGALTTLLVEGHRRGIPFGTAQAVRLVMPVAGPGCAELKGFLPAHH
ncbi:phosphohistidine phosphatase SixA [Mangrovitalea sediminis]|uniref:phosphohistidine phosphatase SixA n=1 Tax=Mangrovitalea sediminis TaxID=1982043 RepID=UPI000BE5789F|nr:phosphohistidine phosphatase SixA [Mangrovitalea sediminis]